METHNTNNKTSMFDIVKNRVRSKPNVPLSKIRDLPDKPHSGRICLGCGKKQSTTDVPFLSCAKCQAVHYCSRDCQLLDWKGRGDGPTKPQKHKDLCPQLQMANREFRAHPTAGPSHLRTRVFSDWADQHGVDGTFHLHEFLARRGLLGGTEVGFWAIPNVWTPYHTVGPDGCGFQNGQMLLEASFPSLQEGWTSALAPNEIIDVTQPPNRPLPEQGIASWQDYIQWRELSPTSVAPLLMTNVLTIYQMIHHQLQLTAQSARSTESLLIYVLAVEAELNQIPLLQELLYLLPGLDLTLVYLSPAAKAICDQRGDRNHCLLSRDFVLDVTHGNGRLCVQLDPHHGLYEDVPNTILPTAVLGLNAGLASYPTWAPAMHKILRQKTPFCFSDQTRHIQQFVQTQWLPNVVSTINRALPNYRPLELPPENVTIDLNPFHGIVGRDVAHVLAPNLSNGYLLTGYPV